MLLDAHRDVGIILNDGAQSTGNAGEPDRGNCLQALLDVMGTHVFQTHSGTSSEDSLFDRTWAEALIATGLERLSVDYKSEAKEKLFNELSIFLTSGAEPLPSYAELAARLGMTESTLRSHVTRLRARYRQVLRAEVRRTVDNEADVDEELHELLRVLTGA